MKNKLIFAVSAFGLLAGVAAAVYFGVKHPPLKPAFPPPADPFAAGIYAEGIVESDMPSGKNVNVYPEFPGTVVEIPVREGQEVKRGDLLLRLEDSIPRAQRDLAAANLKSAQDTYAKLAATYAADPGSISRDQLDTQANSVAAAKATLALQAATLAKYSIRALQDGVVMSINASLGDYVSSQGLYDSYTQAAEPLLALGTPSRRLNVRCYVDEILVPRLPPPARIRARMTVRGSTQAMILDYVGIQPFVSPKIELADQKQERVDVRVLPVIFRVEAAPGLRLYPGELVDVYIGEGPAAETVAGAPGGR
jgi:HlyD family secretion protein